MPYFMLATREEDGRDATMAMAMAMVMATAMTQSRCPLAKLKYLAFRRARKRLHDQRSSASLRAKPHTRTPLGVTNEGLGATRVSDT